MGYEVFGLARFQPSKSIFSTQLQLIKLAMKMKQSVLLGLIGSVALFGGIACSEPDVLESNDTPTEQVADPETAPEADPDAEITAIVRDHLLESASPEAPEPDIDDIRIVENYAIATWLWGEMGGQALLMETQDQWEVVTSSGGVLAEVSTLEGYGVPTDIATQLSELPE